MGWVTLLRRLQPAGKNDYLVARVTVPASVVKQAELAASNPLQVRCSVRVHDCVRLGYIGLCSNRTGTCACACSCSVMKAEAQAVVIACGQGAQYLVGVFAWGVQGEYVLLWGS